MHHSIRTKRKKRPVRPAADRRAALGLILFFLLLFPPGTGSAHDLVWPGEKLKILFPEAETFRQKNLYVSAAQQERIEERLGRRLPPEDLKPSIYLALVRGTPGAKPRPAAAMMFIDAWGEGGKIEMGIVVGGDGRLRRAAVFENREAVDLAESGLLRQFEGKSESEDFRVGGDITVPPGVPEATARALAEGARRGLVIINEMFRRRR